MNEPHRWIAHVDLDAFFASCEQRDHPEYRGRPVVVGAMPGNRGVVAAASYEARKFGIRSAMPIGEASRRCPQAVYLRPDMSRYREASQAVFTILESISPAVEKASIDEAYLDISGLEKIVGPPQRIGQLIRERIHTGTQLTASVGVGPNRLVAKLASEACKPDGLLVVPAEHVAEWLAPMPVSNLRGLGRKTGLIFDEMGIRTIGELRRASRDRLAKRLGNKAIDSYLRQANGIASARIVTDRRRKSISKERTFGSDTSNRARLHEVLRELAAGVARTARQEGLSGTVVTLKIRYRGFDTHTRQRSLPAPTSDERLMLSTAKTLLRDSGLPDRPVRLIGIGLSGWSKPGRWQRDLFGDQPGAGTDQRILDTIDAVTEKFGRPVLQVGLPSRKD